MTCSIGISELDETVLCDSGKKTGLGGPVGDADKPDGGGPPTTNSADRRTLSSRSVPFLGELPDPAELALMGGCKFDDTEPWVLCVPCRVDLP
jgi:hypothetical protein